MTWQLPSPKAGNLTMLDVVLPVALLVLHTLCHV